MKTKKVIKSESYYEERLIENPPYCVFGTPSLPFSQSIIFTVGAMRKMLEGLKDEDSFRIEWFAAKATEYSYIIEGKKIR